MKIFTPFTTSHSGKLSSLRGLLFIVVMMLATSSAFAQAHFETIDGLRYLIDEDAKNAALVTNSDEKYSGDIVVPEKVTAKDEKVYPVTAFRDNCFKECYSLTSITIPASVTSLGNYCFYSCYGLTSITIPASVTSLGDYCFSSCYSLTSITIPSSVTSLGNACFSYCHSLISITIPSSVTSLGEECLSHCSGLTNITIPTSVTSLGDFCFSNCSGLTSITIPASVTSLGSGCFYQCKGLTNITIPSSITSLGNYCFSNCSGLTSITIPSSVTAFGEKCFKECYSLTSITIPASVTSLGNYCFSNCSGLTSITIPSSVTSLGSWCFSGCKGLTNITIPSSVTSLENECFRSCSGLTSITIPSSVTSLGYMCFGDCSGLTSITIPSSVTSLGICCFEYCSKLESIYFKGKCPSYTESTSIPTTCIFYVPKEYLQDYKDALGDTYPYIYEWKVTKCETPTITYADGSLQFTASTVGAEYHYTITDADMANDKLSKDGKVELAAAYKISAYATADGHQPSDKATATLYWVNANLENDPSTNINQAQTRGIVATSDGGIVTLSGLDNGEVVKFFSPDGRQLGAAKAENGIASCAVAGPIVIAKLGEQSIKLIVK